MFKLLDRYIWKEIVPPFLLGLLVYSFAFLMKDILRFPDMIINQNVPAEVVFRLIIYLIPSILMFTVPMSVLLGILAGLSRMSSDSEITAMKTLGVGSGKLLRPILWFCIAGMIMTSGLSHYLAPRANYAFGQILSRSLQAQVQMITPREFHDAIPDTVIFIQDITRDKAWKNVFVSLLREGEDPQVIFADEGRLNIFPEEQRATMELFGAFSHTYKSYDPDKYHVTEVSRMEEEVDPSIFENRFEEKGSREKDTRELFRDLPLVRKELKNMVESGALPIKILSQRRGINAHLIEIHKRFAFPSACFIFAFLGIALGATTRKGGRAGGFTLSIGIILVYYILITAGERLAWYGRIAPWIGIWGPNILLFIVGLVLFARSRSEASLFPGMERLRTVFRRPRTTVEPQSDAPPGKRLTFFFPTILDRYILRKFLTIFMLTLVSMLTVFIVIRFFERINSVYTHNKSLLMFFDYLWYSVPDFINQILPVTTLTSALLTLGIMAKFNEVTAMKAAGISLYRMLVVLMLFAGLICSGSFVLQENILPFTNKKTEEIWARINDRPPRIFNPFERNWVIGKNGDRIYHYNYYDPVEGSFSRMSIFDIDPRNWTLKRRFYAEKAYLKDRRLAMVDTWKRTFQASLPDEYLTSKEDFLDLEEDSSYFLKEWKEPNQLSYPELKEYIRDIEDNGFDSVRFRVDLLYKVSFPLASLVMVFLGIPFAFSMGRRGTLVGIGLSLIIAMVYWGAIGLFKSLGYANLLSAFLAAWGPNLIFGLLGLYLLFTVKT